MSFPELPVRIFPPLEKRGRGGFKKIGENLKWGKFGLGVILLGSVLGCAGNMAAARLDGPKPAAAPAEYMIGPGDVVRISYFKQYGGYNGDYVLAPGDAVSIDIEGHPEWKAAASLNPDGKIYLYQIGQIKAAGLTYAQLQQLLIKQYSEVIVNPRINLFFTDWQVELKDFLAKLSRNQDGSSYIEVPVRTDGQISLPLVNQVEVAGATVKQATEAINQRYKKIFRDLDVALNVTATNSKYIAVLGEVKKPGVFPLTSPLTSAQAIATGGGFMDTANLSEVILVRNGREQIINIDLNEMEEPEAAAGQGVLLAPNDVVFVPKKGIAKANMFVDQYIRKLLPIPIVTGFSYNLNNQ